MAVLRFLVMLKLNRLGNSNLDSQKDCYKHIILIYNFVSNTLLGFQNRFTTDALFIRYNLTIIKNICIEKIHSVSFRQMSCNLITKQHK